MTRARDTFDAFEQQDRGRFGENEERREPQRHRPRVTGASDLVDLDMVHHVDRDTAKAVFVSFGLRIEGQYLPRSQIEIEAIGTVERKFKGEFDQKVRITLPEWLAKREGLI